MKNFLAILFLIAAAVVLYQTHYKQVEAAALEAAAKARSDTLRAMTPKTTPIPETPAPPPIHAVQISHGLEPLYNEVFTDLDRQRPVDLAPPLLMTREHILDSKVRADAGTQAVYDLASKAVAAMVDVAEERTKALQSLLEASSRPAAALDGKTSSTTTNGFFAQSSAKKWDEERRRRKPGVDALMANLRNAERNWNQKLPVDAPVDRYEAPPYQQLLITVQPLTSANPLERGTYNQKRAIYPWRTIYYDQYGYRHTY